MKRKWEELYEEMKDGKLDELIAKLQEKYDNKTMTREELKNLQTYKRIKENLPKVANVFEYRGKLEENLKKLKAENDRRKNLRDSTKENQKLESELANLMSERAKIEDELKKVDPKDSKKAELEGKLAEVKTKIDKNNELFSKSQETISSIPMAEMAFRNLSDDDVEARSVEISTKISKCNMICSTLLQGKSWDAIEFKLDNWRDRELKGKKSDLDKMKKATERGKTERTGEEMPDVSGTSRESKEEESSKDEEGKNLPVKQSEFERKHPRLAKFVNFFKNIGKKKEKTVEPEKEEEPQPKADKGEEFKKYIKEVAEKGMKQADKDRLEEKKAQAKAKIAEKENEDKKEKDDMEIGV